MPSPFRHSTPEIRQLYLKIRQLRKAGRKLIKSVEEISRKIRYYMTGYPGCSEESLPGVKINNKDKGKLIER